MRVLHVEDDPRDAALARRELQRLAPQITLHSVASVREARDCLESSGSTSYDLLLTDLRLPDGDGLGLLAYVRHHRLPLAVVVITGQGDEETAVAALKAGADDYVLLAGDGAEARERLVRESVDAVVTDVNMPHMDGFSLIEAIRSEPGWRGLPVVMLSGAYTEEEQTRGRRLGADICLDKATAAGGDLVAALRRLLGARRSHPT